MPKLHLYLPLSSHCFWRGNKQQLWSGNCHLEKQLFSHIAVVLVFVLCISYLVFVSVHCTFKVCNLNRKQPNICCHFWRETIESLCHIHRFYVIILKCLSSIIICKQQWLVWYCRRSKNKLAKNAYWGAKVDTRGCFGHLFSVHISWTVFVHTCSQGVWHGKVQIATLIPGGLSTTYSLFMCVEISLGIVGKKCSERF